MDDKYRIVLEVPADQYDHIGGVIAILDSALRDSHEFPSTLPVYRSAELVTAWEV